MPQIRNVTNRDMTQVSLILKIESHELSDVSWNRDLRLFSSDDLAGKVTWSFVIVTQTIQSRIVAIHFWVSFIVFDKAVAVSALHSHSSESAAKEAAAKKFRSMHFDSNR